MKYAIGNRVEIVSQDSYFNKFRGKKGIIQNIENNIYLIRLDFGFGYIGIANDDELELIEVTELSEIAINLDIKLNSIIYLISKLKVDKNSEELLNKINSDLESIIDNELVKLFEL